MSLCFVSLMKLNPLGFQHIFLSVHNFDAVVDFQRSESFQSCWARRSMWPSSQEEVATESGPKRDGAGDTEPSRCSVTAGNLLFNTFNASTQRWCSLLLLLRESSQMWGEDSIQDLYSVKYFIQHLNGCNEHFSLKVNFALMRIERSRSDPCQFGGSQWCEKLDKIKCVCVTEREKW